MRHGRGAWARSDEERWSRLTLHLRCDGPGARAARRLGTSRATLYRRLAELGIPPKTKG